MGAHVLSCGRARGLARTLLLRGSVPGRCCGRCWCCATVPRGAGRSPRCRGSSSIARSNEGGGAGAGAGAGAERSASEREANQPAGQSLTACPLPTIDELPKRPHVAALNHRSSSPVSLSSGLVRAKADSSRLESEVEGRKAMTLCRLQLFFEFEEHLPQAQKTQLGELFEQHVRPNTCYKNHVDGRDWRCVRHRSFCLVVLPVCQLPCTTESRNVL